MIPWRDVDDVPRPKAWIRFVTVKSGGKDVALAAVPVSDWAVVRDLWLAANGDAKPDGAVAND